MVETLYIEKAVVDLPRTQSIVARYPNANQILIDRYGEVFNSHNQNFRIQKNNPSLILAAKQNKKVISTPEQYETGGGANYYFSHMLNCVYDCRYCFLQGMFRSANYLVFVNYEDFLADIKSIAAEHKNDKKPVWFFSGYDCDSLAYEPVTSFAEYFVSAFQDVPNSVLELRTKSTQVRSLLKQEATDNVVVASSLSPALVAKELEVGAPPLHKRLDALAKLQKAGWRIGLRFDPVIWHEDYMQSYQNMIDSVFNHLDADKIDSLTLGGFRLPKDHYKSMFRLYPEHWLFSAGLTEEEGMVSYRREIEEQVLTTVKNLSQKWMPKEKLFVYPSFA